MPGRSQDDRFLGDAVGKGVADPLFVGEQHTLLMGCRRQRQQPGRVDGQRQVFPVRITEQRGGDLQITEQQGQSAAGRQGQLHGAPEQALILLEGDGQIDSGNGLIDRDGGHGAGCGGSTEGHCQAAHNRGKKTSHWNPCRQDVSLVSSGDCRTDHLCRPGDKTYMHHH